MSPANDNPASGRHAAAQPGERILEHDRQQLSALIDGAMPPDEARFLLRRLQHDEELAACWSRWQLCGNVLRGQASEILPSGFSQRVAAAIAAEAPAPGRKPIHGARWMRWGGGAALAASVAVIALFVSRQLPDAQAPAQAPAQVAVDTSQPAPTPAVPSTGTPAPAAPENPGNATRFAAAAVAVADVPRRAAMRRSRAQGQRAAVRRSRAAEEAQVAVAAAIMPPVESNDPFAPRTVIQGRPWPRALLPTAPASGAFTVEYGGNGATSAFYPFAPREQVAAPAETAPAGDDVDARRP